MGQILSHNGYKLTSREDTFIDYYIQSGNIRESYIKAYRPQYINPDTDTPYSTKQLQEHYTGEDLDKAISLYKCASQNANKVLNKSYINLEINWRKEQVRNANIADTTEILEYFTKVMRGQETDAFGLDAPLSERTKAAVELAKRTTDIDRRLEAKGQSATGTVTIQLDWD